MNTSVELKRKFWEPFVKGCQSQWECGGERYALAKDKEFTDLVCEVVGNQWIGGNIVKYVGEIINAKKRGEKLPEVNFFKIAVYVFIWWLKEKGNFTQIDKGEEFEK